MSYAGVESDYEYHMRVHYEAEQNAARYRQERDPKFIAAKAKREREDALNRAQRQLAFHREKVKDLRATVRRLEKKQ